MFKKVMVALDGSAMSEGALPCVTDVAQRFRSSVHLVSVISPAEHGLGLDRLFDAYLARIVENLKAAKVKADSVLLEGSPSEQLLHFAEENGVELIVVTSLGKGGVGRWHVGSVAEKIATASNTPVLLIPVGNRARKITGPCFSNVLVPVDVSELGEAALPCVEALSAMTDYSVRLLNVEVPPYMPTKLAEKYYKETAEYLRKKTRGYLETTVSQLKAKGVEAFYDIVSGDPAEKILEYARNKRCNLIAMSTHGRSGIVRWALGSVANKVLHETDVPLLLVRAPEAACPLPEAK